MNRGPFASGCTDQDSDTIRTALLIMTPADKDPRFVWSERDLAKLVKKKNFLAGIRSAIERSRYFLRVAPGRVYNGRPVLNFERKRLDLRKLQTVMAAFDDAESIFGSFHEWCQGLAAVGWHDRLEFPLECPRYWARPWAAGTAMK